MADNIRVTADTREFSAALREYALYSSKPLPELITEAAIDVAYKGNQNTNRAIRGDIIPYESGFYNAILASGKTKYGKVVKGAKGGYKNKELAKKIYKRRIGAINYSKALWLNVAKKLGANVKALAKKANSIDGTAQGEYVKGIKAKKFVSLIDKASLKPQAEIHIDGLKSDHAAKVMSHALQKAVDAASKKLFAKIARKQRDLARKKSGRKR